MCGKRLLLPPGLLVRVVAILIAGIVTTIVMGLLPGVAPGLLNVPASPAAYAQGTDSTGRGDDEPISTARQRLSRAHSMPAEALTVEDELPPELRARVVRLEQRLMCACPKENWIKTLRGCPDGCAIPQKIEVRRMLEEGASDEQILQAQVDRYGAKVLAAPDLGGIGGLTYLLVPALVLVAVVVMAVVLVRWGRRAEQRRGQNDRLEELVTPEEMAAVERELEEWE